MKFNHIAVASFWVLVAQGTSTAAFVVPGRQPSRQRVDFPALYSAAGDKKYNDSISKGSWTMDPNGYMTPHKMSTRKNPSTNTNHSDVARESARTSPPPTDGGNKSSVKLASDDHFGQVSVNRDDAFYKYENGKILHSKKGVITAPPEESTRTHLLSPDDRANKAGVNRKDSLYTYYENVDVAVYRRPSSKITEGVSSPPDDHIGKVKVKDDDSIYRYNKGKTTGRPKTIEESVRSPPDDHVGKVKVKNDDLIYRYNKGTTTGRPKTIEDVSGKFASLTPDSMDRMDAIFRYDTDAGYLQNYQQSTNNEKPSQVGYASLSPDQPDRMDAMFRYDNNTGRPQKAQQRSTNENVSKWGYASLSPDEPDRMDAMYTYDQMQKIIAENEALEEARREVFTEENRMKETDVTGEVEWPSSTEANRMVALEAIEELNRIELEDENRADSKEDQRIEPGQEVTERSPQDDAWLKAKQARIMRIRAEKEAAAGEVQEEEEATAIANTQPITKAVEDQMLTKEDAERLARDEAWMKAKAARIQRVRAEKEAAEAEQMAIMEAERLEAERVAAEQAEIVRLEAERIAAEQAEAARLEAERIAAEQAEAARLEAERIAAEHAEAARLEAERIAAEQAEAAKLEAQRIAAERAEAAILEARRIAAEQAEAARLEAQRVAAEQAEAARIAAEQAEIARLEAERIAAELEAEVTRLEAQRKIAEQEAVAARLEAQRIAGEHAQLTQQVETRGVSGGESKGEGSVSGIHQDSLDDVHVYLQDSMYEYKYETKQSLEEFPKLSSDDHVGKVKVGIHDARLRKERVFIPHRISNQSGIEGGQH